MTFFSFLEKKNISISQLFTEQFSPLPAFYFTTAPYFPPMRSQLNVVSIVLQPSLLSFTLRKTKPQVWGLVLSLAAQQQCLRSPVRFYGVIQTHSPALSPRQSAICIVYLK